MYFYLFCLIVRINKYLLIVFLFFYLNGELVDLKLDVNGNKGYLFSVYYDVLSIFLSIFYIGVFGLYNDFMDYYYYFYFIG